MSYFFLRDIHRVPCETAAVLAHVLCAPHNYAPTDNVILFEATYVG